MVIHSAYYTHLVCMAFITYLGGRKISWLIWKDPDAGKDWGQEEKGMTEDEMVRWHHQLNGRGFGWTLGVGDGQGGLTCCSSWGRKKSDMTEWLNWTELKIRNLFSLESDSIELILVAVFQMPFIFYGFCYMHYLDIIDTVFHPLPEGGNFPLSGSPRTAPTVVRDGRQKLICKPLKFSQIISLK